MCTTTSWRASACGRSRRSMSSRWSSSACTSTTACGAPCRRWACIGRPPTAGAAARPACWPRRPSRVTSRFRWRCSPAGCGDHGAPGTGSRRRARRQVGAPPRRDPARQPGEQGQAPRHRRRLRARGGVRGGVAGRARVCRLVLLLPGLARRAHSIAAQGGINAAKNYQNDGDSVFRLFYDTLKGGDFRAREANVYRLAELSVNIIDQCVAQGVPFAREYGGLLANRSFGGVQVSRTFYARGQTGQQLLLGAYQALSRQIGVGKVTMYPRSEMLDLVVVDGRARGIIVRDLVSGAVSAHAADAVVLATGGYANVYYLSTNAKGCNVTAIWRAHKRGAAFANPGFTQIHPTCIPVTGHHQAKLTLMSESLRNDGRIWVPKAPGDTRAPGDIPESERDYYLERLYPSYGNLAPRDIASRRAKEVCDEGRGVGPGGNGVYLDFRDAIARLGRPVIAERYGNLFEMYERITAENPFERPMRIFPAPHYTMGGLWVDYNLMTTVDGLYAIGEANFSDHGANRLGSTASTPRIRPSVRRKRTPATGCGGCWR